MIKIVDQWTETALIGVTKASGSEIQFAALTDTIDIDWGEKAIESTAIVNGGRVTKYTPETDTTITLEMFPVGTTAVTPKGMSQWFLGNDADTTQPLWTINTRTRYLFRIAILWTDDSTAAGAASATAVSTNSLRFSFWNCYLTSLTFAFTDDILTCTAKFTCPPFNKSGSGLIATEEGTATALLALASFSSGTTPATA